MSFFCVPMKFYLNKWQGREKNLRAYHRVVVCTKAIYVQIILFPNGYTISTDNTYTHKKVAHAYAHTHSTKCLGTLWLPNKIAFYCYGNGFSRVEWSTRKKGAHIQTLTNILILMEYFFPLDTFSRTMYRYTINISMLLLHFERPD